MKKIITLMLVFLFSCLLAQDKAVERYLDLIAKGQQANEQKDYQGAVHVYRELLTYAPYYPAVHYSLARLYMLVGDHQQALACLRTAVLLGQDTGDQLDSLFLPLISEPVFKEIQSLIESGKQPVNSSKTAFTLPEKDLIPEGITYDPVEECFYLSSCHKCKIVKADKNGTTTDFTVEKQDGLRSVLGMQVDARRRILWAASAVSRPVPGVDTSEVGWSGLFKYDLNTGELIKKYTVFEEGINHLFNDITITSEGDVYMTDMDYQAIYRVLHDRDVLEIFLRPDEFLWPNGISLGADDQTLYMASSRDGVYLISIPEKSCHLLDQPKDVTLFGIDGMYYYQNSLVCVQNGLNRINRFYLNPAGDRVLKMELIETRNPHFILPTTGVIVENRFFYIANSQVRSYDADGNLFPPDRLKDVVILQTKLK